MYLAEADRRPEGAIPLFARVFALEGEGPEVLSLGEDPVLGEVRARALLRGERRALEEALAPQVEASPEEGSGWQRLAYHLLFLVVGGFWGTSWARERKLSRRKGRKATKMTPRTA